MQIYILVNGEQQGPFTPDQVKGYLAIGQYQYTDLAWREGMTDWQPLSQFPEFAPRGHRTPNYGAIPIRQLATQQKARKGRGLLTVVLWVVIAAAAAVGGYYGYQYGYKYWREHRKSAEPATPAAPTSEFASGAPGIPKTLEELNRWYEEPPAGQNAAAFFQQGFDALQITNADKSSASLPLIGKAAWPQAGAQVSAAMKMALRSLLERNQAALDLFERGARCSGSRYPLDLTKGTETAVSHVGTVRTATQLAALEALWQAESHDGTNAGRGVLLTLASARTLDAEPLVISQLTRFAGEGLAVDALEQTINRAALPPESLTQLQAAFDRAAAYDAAGTGLNRALVGERVTSLAFFDTAPEKVREMFDQAKKNPAISNSVRQAFGDSPEQALASLKGQRQFAEESIDQFLVARKESFPARLKADDTVTTRANDAKARQYVISAMMLPGLSKVTDREGVSLARLELSRVAIALERFRSAHTNQYPAALRELTPKFLASIPADPFDGQPLRYQKGAQGGYVLRSIGADARDDGAVRKMGSDDLWFTVVRPPRAL